MLPQLGRSVTHTVISINISSLWEDKIITNFQNGILSQRGKLFAKPKKNINEYKLSAQYLMQYLQCF